MTVSRLLGTAEIVTALPLPSELTVSLPEPSTTFEPLPLALT